MLSTVLNSRTTGETRRGLRPMGYLRKGQTAPAGTARAVGRRLLDTLAGVNRRAAAPSATRPATAAALPVAEQSALDPAGLFAADELPPLADIEAAAERYFGAAEETRHADRTKRGARKLLDRLPAGLYGPWQVERIANAREVADLDAIRAIFTAHGLGPVPMKPCAPSLKVGPVLDVAEFLAAATTRP